MVGLKLVNLEHDLGNDDLAILEESIEGVDPIRDDSAFFVCGVQKWFTKDN